MTTLLILSSDNLTIPNFQRLRKLTDNENDIVVNGVRYTSLDSLGREETEGIKMLSLGNLQIIVLDTDLCSTLLNTVERSFPRQCNDKNCITVQGIRYYPKYRIDDLPLEQTDITAPIRNSIAPIVADTPPTIIDTAPPTDDPIVVDTPSTPDAPVFVDAPPVIVDTPPQVKVSPVITVSEKPVETSSNLPSKYMEINGTRCYPKYNIGIAITTKNRHDILKISVEKQLHYLPEDAILFVIDDGSDVPVTVPDGVYLFRFHTSQGIATAKNKCLELLMDYGCEHLFLFDDDCYPVVDHWPQKYINSPEPHFAHSWDLIATWQDSRHIAYHLVGGTMLYYERKVIEDVGGMRTIFGRYGCEHVNLSDRIYNRGWTSWRYPDLVDAETLFYEFDRYKKGVHKSAAEDADLEYNQKIGRDLWLTMLDDDEYVEYRTKENVIITTLLTSVIDNQRQEHMKADVSMLTELAQSIQYGRLIVLHDNLIDPQLTTGNGLPVEFVKMENMINPYFARWLLVYQWLRENKNIDKVWVVDGTDVVQLRDPFDLVPDTLYIGQEQSSLDNEWLICNHPDERIQKFIRENKEKTLLNPGTIGGDAATVKQFAHLISKYWFDGHMEHLGVWQVLCGVGDMGATQLVAYTQFENLFYGPSVNTLFKGEQKDSFARWKHK